MEKKKEKEDKENKKEKERRKEKGRKKERKRENTDISVYLPEGKCVFSFDVGDTPTSDVESLLWASEHFKTTLDLCYACSYVSDLN